MYSTSPEPVTNKTAVRKDFDILKGDAFVFGFVFFEETDGNPPLDITAIDYSLDITGKDKSLAISNADFERPASNIIRKYWPSFNALPLGKYSYKLIATHPDGRVQTQAFGDCHVSKLC